MPLDLTRLQKVKPTPDGGAIAQCPVCAQAKGDSRGQHLRLWADGAFTCAAHPGDRDHRRQIWALAGDPSASSTLSGRARLESSKDDAWARAGRLTRDRILGTPWSPTQIARASPGVIPADPVAQALELLRLFHPRDCVWIGDKWDSGQWRHSLHFRRAIEWIEAGVIAGPQICPSAFYPGVISRTQRTVKSRRFLVVESDTLSYDQQGAVFRYLVDCGLTLRAVVDTAGRSLHGWFDAPSVSNLNKLRGFLPQLGADPALFNPAQPCRLPGWPRADTQRIPTLIYLAP